jgi:hypothetical protein
METIMVAEDFFVNCYNFNPLIKKGNFQGIVAAYLSTRNVINDATIIQKSAEDMLENPPSFFYNSAPKVFTRLRCLLLHLNRIL